MQSGRTITGAFMVLLAWSVHAQALNLKDQTLSGYLADCDRFGVRLCQAQFGATVRESWARDQGGKTAATCTSSARDESRTKTEIGLPIWHWLTGHPELGDTNAYQAFVRAEHAIYPCADS